MSQVAEYLPSKCEALSSNPSFLFVSVQIIDCSATSLEIYNIYADRAIQ
jgi:hypothetical protein